MDNLTTSMHGKKRSGTEDKTDSTATSRPEDRLVVVRMLDGQVIKGVLQWCSEPGHATSLPHLPDVLHIRHESGPSSTVRVANSKAVFFVRTHEGEPEYEVVKFSSGHIPSDLWVQVRLIDGEVLEGSIVNNLDLITGPGFWLWPSDKLWNSSCVYVPKTAAVEFHVLGVATSSLS